MAQRQSSFGMAAIIVDARTRSQARVKTAGFHPMISLPMPKFGAREAAMESIISNLVARFEQGSLSRRELVRGLALLAASGTTAAAQEDLNFKAATIDHVSLQVADLQRSIEFYQTMFGFPVVSQEQARSIMRLGNSRTLVSLNRESPAGIVDHFAIGIPKFNKDVAVRYFKERGATPLQGNFAGFHIKDPDGIRVQISAQS
jgi:catechol 2,3-dioxygenase-like lactoylglutathione lyase family enzyme